MTNVNGTLRARAQGLGAAGFFGACGLPRVASSPTSWLRSSFSATAARTLTLQASNTYTGGTVVNAGTLLVNNTVRSGTGTGAVTVDSGGTLGGIGLDSLGQSLGWVRLSASFSIGYSGSDVLLNYEAIPEPSTWALVAEQACWRSFSFVGDQPGPDARPPPKQFGGNKQQTAAHPVGCGFSLCTRHGPVE